MSFGRGAIEVVVFRLMLVLLATTALSTGVAWALSLRSEREASLAIARSFDAYNQYLDACGNSNTGIVWDLAQSARAALDQATLDRATYERRQDVLAWLGSGLSLGLVASFYALRWAVTGRVRPLWLLGRGTAR